MLTSAPEEVKRIFSLQNANQVMLNPSLVIHLGGKDYSGIIVINVYFMQLFLQFEHRKVATEKVREQYTDRAEKKSKLFQTGGSVFLTYRNLGKQ